VRKFTFRTWVTDNYNLAVLVLDGFRKSPSHTRPYVTYYALVLVYWGRTAKKVLHHGDSEGESVLRSRDVHIWASVEADE
jgi:hypothetical protein